MRGVLRLAPLALLLLTSCSAVGNYAADRGLDFLDQYRVAVGAGTSVGVRAKALGLADTGLMMGLRPRATSLGWRYGTPLVFNINDSRMDGNQAQIITTSTTVGLNIGDGSYASGWNSFAVLPAVFTWTDATPTDFDWEVPEEGTTFEDSHWLWSSETFANNRYAQIHAFDVEIGIALLVYLDVGLSPGELLDFWLGWLTIDIAQDDGRL